MVPPMTTIARMVPKLKGRRAHAQPTAASAAQKAPVLNMSVSTPSTGTRPRTSRISTAVTSATAPRKISPPSDTVRSTVLRAARRFTSHPRSYTTSVSARNTDEMTAKSSPEKPRSLGMTLSYSPDARL